MSDKWLIDAQLISIVKNLMNGVRYKTKNGRIIAMGGDYQIGFLTTSLTTGEEFIFEDIGLSGLHLQIEGL